MTVFAYLFTSFIFLCVAIYSVSAIVGIIFLCKFYADNITKYTIPICIATFVGVFSVYVTYIMFPFTLILKTIQ